MPENIAFGREGFSRYFISCRGLEGQTSGAPFVARMSSPVPFLAPADVQACGDRQLKWIVDNGLWPPGSKGVLTDQQIWSLNCHDVHGTGDYAELRKPANAICLECHAPGHLTARGRPRSKVTLAMTDKYKIRNPCSLCQAGKPTQ